MIDIAQLNGRELDAEIAMRLFGFDWWRSTVSSGRALFAEGHKRPWFKYRATGDESLCADWDVDVPRYSISIESAIRVIEKTDTWMLVGGQGKYTTSFGREQANGDLRYFNATATTPAEAICRAALKATDPSAD